MVLQGREKERGEREKTGGGGGCKHWVGREAYIMVVLSSAIHAVQEEVEGRKTVEVGWGGECLSAVTQTNI